MTTRSWIRKLFSRTPRTIRKAPARCRPGVEALECRLTPTYTAFTQLTGAANPFNGVNVGDVGGRSRPVLADLDGNGTLDAVVGRADGSISYFKNTGSATNPVFTPQTGTANPFNAINVGAIAAPALGDVDGNGTLDLVVGNGGATLFYYKNTGTAINPVFTQKTGTDNPFNSVSVGTFTAPALGDVDGNGTLDLVVGSLGGDLNYFENTGTATSPVYTWQQAGAANPFNGF
ncbi:MAG TPA: VCBS repeat-containing protein, partial [Gemmataceae bacterium]|nr:VCBS repeat-containing protein [Gemmataceae bacterium]